MMMAGLLLVIVIMVGDYDGDGDSNSVFMHFHIITKYYVHYYPLALSLRLGFGNDLEPNHYLNCHYCLVVA